MSSTKKITVCAILTAIVAILQYLGSFIRLGPFCISLVLIPIVIGAALCGKAAGTWLGFVFGLVVLISGQAGAFMAVNPIGTIIAVIPRCALCGFAAGGVYKLIARKNTLAAAITAAVVCPVVNTGVFLLCCRIFFMDLLATWAEGLGFGSNVAAYMIFVLVGGNFLVELAVNIILSPIIIKIINIRKVTAR